TETAGRGGTDRRTASNTTRIGAAVKQPLTGKTGAAPLPRWKRGRVWGANSYNSGVSLTDLLGRVNTGPNTTRKGQPTTLRSRSHEHTHADLPSPVPRFGRGRLCRPANPTGLPAGTGPARPGPEWANQPGLHRHRYDGPRPPASLPGQSRRAGGR